MQSSWGAGRAPHTPPVLAEASLGSRLAQRCSALGQLGERSGAGDGQDPHGQRAPAALGEGAGGWCWGHLGPVPQREVMPVTFPWPHKQPWLLLNSPRPTFTTHVPSLMAAPHLPQGGPLDPTAITPHPSRSPFISPHGCPSCPPLRATLHLPPGWLLTLHGCWSSPLIFPHSSPLRPTAITPHPSWPPLTATPHPSSWLLPLTSHGHPSSLLMISPHGCRPSHPMATPHFPS